jgi:hypothetical protein
MVRPFEFSEEDIAHAANQIREAEDKKIREWLDEVADKRLRKDHYRQWRLKHPKVAK